MELRILYHLCNQGSDVAMGFKQIDVTHPIDFYAMMAQESLIIDSNNRIKLGNAFGGATCRYGHGMRRLDKIYWDVQCMDILLFLNLRLS